MWALIVTGIFSGAVNGPVMQLDADTVKVLVEMSGDITISQIGFGSEEACKVQLAAATPRHQFSMNGMKVTVKSAECRNVEEKSEGKGPKA
jgi:hypothetical protein